MANWIEDDVIKGMLESKNITLLKGWKGEFCVSSDFQYCLVARLHDAWEIMNEGWRDSNSPPTDGSHGRLLLNFYAFDHVDKIYSWFKIFIPARYRVFKLESLKDKYKIITDSSEIIGKFDLHYEFMRELMTGDAETEREIEEKFKLLDTK